MFNNMKNKIREKTGGELPKFNTSSSLFGKSRSNQHSRQNSQSSINSFLSDQSTKDEWDIKSSSSIPKLPVLDTPKMIVGSSSKSDIDRENKLVEKEKEWCDKEKTYVSDLLKQTKELQEALALVEENKKKYLCCQEEKEQLEFYQKQEISKIKQLLLAKEEENDANGALLKEMQSSVESLRQEVNRLKPFEEQISNCQDDLECLRHTSEKERWTLTSSLTQKEETIRHLEERIAVLTHRTEADCQALGAQLSTDERVRSLIAERALLERRMEEAHIHLSEIKTSWSNKIATLETQVGRLSRQAGEEGVERRNAEKRITELESKLEQYENEKEDLKEKVMKLTRERDSVASELKQLTSDINQTSASYIPSLEEGEESNKLKQLLLRLEMLSKENEALKQSNEESRNISDESLSKEMAKNNELNVEIIKLKNYSQGLAVALEEEKKVKDETLLRNAEISQLVQLSERELKEQQTQSEELFRKVAALESQLKISEQSCQTIQLDQKSKNGSDEEKLKEKIKELETEISDKNKSIRKLQQNLYDVKKTLQTELKNNVETTKPSCDNNMSSSHLADEDINFKYMKHVLIKFLTSSEYEAQQLTKAVATLLKLNSDEERLIRETLEWRSSWFGPKFRVKIPFNSS